MVLTFFWKSAADPNPCTLRLLKDTLAWRNLKCSLLSFAKCNIDLVYARGLKLSDSGSKGESFSYWSGSPTISVVECRVHCLASSRTLDSCCSLLNAISFKSLLTSSESLLLWSVPNTFVPEWSCVEDSRRWMILFLNVSLDLRL